MTAQPKTTSFLSAEKVERHVSSLARAGVASARHAMDENVFPSDVLSRSWGGDRTADLILRAATSPASLTNTPDLAQVSVAFLESLVPVSAGADVLNRSIGVNLDGIASIKLPTMTTPTADFVGEAQAFPAVQLVTTAGATVAPRKLGAVVILTSEMIASSNAEALVRESLLDATAPAIDKALFSTTAGDATRPAGLLNGIAGLTPTAAIAGAASEVLVDDLQKLATALAPVAGNSGIVLVASPDVAVSLVTRIVGTAPWPVLTSSSLAAKTVIAIATRAVVAAIEGAPAVDARRETTVHMATPAAPLATGTPGVMASPVASMFQGDLVALRLRWSISWALRDTRGVAWISGVNW
jgi:hypothetical protein